MEQTPKNGEYLNVRYDSLIGRMAREWTAGSTLSMAVKRLKSWHGFTSDADQQEMIDLWRSFYKAPYFSLIPKSKHVNTDPEYLAWKGEIGPGKMLKDIVAKHKASTGYHEFNSSSGES